MLGLANRVLAFVTNQCIVPSMAGWVVEKAGKGFKGGFRGLVIPFIPLIKKTRDPSKRPEGQAMNATRQPAILPKLWLHISGRYRYKAGKIKSKFSKN